MIKELTKTKTGNQNGVTLRGTKDGYSLKINSLKGISKQKTTTGRQLANITDGTQTLNGITVTRKDGVITVSGTPITVDGYHSVFGVGRVETIKSSTKYTTHVTEKTVGIGVAIGNTGGSLNLPMISTATSISGSIASEMVDQLIVINISHNIGTINKSFKIMFNEGTSALEWEPYTNGASPNPEYPQEIESCLVSEIKTTTYEPYQETSVTLSDPVELNGVGGVRNEINLTSEIKKIHKMILDGSENWVYNTESEELIQFTCQLTKEAVGAINNTSTNKNKLMCSHFLVGNQLQKGIWIYSGITLAVVVKKTLASTASEWKTWLSNNNVTLLYELKEEIISELSDEDTEKLIGFSTFNDVTYITTDSEIQPIIEVEYGVYKYKEWSADDKYFNAEDYNRIISNINLVKSLADRLFHSITDISMGEEKTYLSTIYAREMNNIEDALDIINSETYNIDIGNKETFRDNGKTPLWSEFDRIEKSCALLYEKLLEHKDLLPRLAIRLGS